MTQFNLRFTHFNCKLENINISLSNIQLCIHIFKVKKYIQQNIETHFRVCIYFYFLIVDACQQLLFRKVWPLTFWTPWAVYKAYIVNSILKSIRWFCDLHRFIRYCGWWSTKLKTSFFTFLYFVTQKSSSKGNLSYFDAFSIIIM